VLEEIIDGRELLWKGPLIRRANIGEQLDLMLVQFASHEPIEAQ
jgi:hypothetical protein